MRALPLAHRCRSSCWTMRWRPAAAAGAASCARSRGALQQSQLPRGSRPSAVNARLAAPGRAWGAHSTRNPCAYLITASFSWVHPCSLAFVMLARMHAVQLKDTKAWSPSRVIFLVFQRAVQNARWLDAR